ncbi:MAG: hypothetical protein KIT14_09760 [bacterium]|nr:hypothetical protein [bacterium]
MATPEERAVLEHRVAEHRDELRTALHDLERAARARVDVRDAVRERPVPWLVGALLLGAWLGRPRR